MSSITPFSTFLTFQKIPSLTHSHFLPSRKEQTFRSSECTRSQQLASSTGKFETLGSNFRHEIRFSEAAAVYCYSIRSLILNALSFSSVKKRIDFLQQLEYYQPHWLIVLEKLRPQAQFLAMRLALARLLASIATVQEV